MIDRDHEVSIARQAELLGISRGSVDYAPRPVPDSDLKRMRRIDEWHWEHPFMGASRKVLAHRVSISMDAGFCVEALEEALYRYGHPEIVNTDPGAQFTRAEFVEALTSRGIRISLDGKGSWRDNVFVERLWQTVKYAEV